MSRYWPKNAIVVKPGDRVRQTSPVKVNGRCTHRVRVGTVMKHLYDWYWSVQFDGEQYRQNVSSEDLEKIHENHTGSH